MSEPEYDEATCITAGELRALGVAVPDDVPDCGWVRRSAMRFHVGEASMDRDAGRFSIGVVVELIEPFRWVSITLDLPRAE